jgi:hypothetical protein
MAKTFYGVKIESADIHAWYPKNDSFYSFVFQQQDYDETKGKHDFTLVAYAVDKSWNVLGEIKVERLDSNKSTEKNITFANMFLDRTGLAKLYPKNDSISSNLKVCPTGDYTQPKSDSVKIDAGYLAYEAVTEDPYNLSTQLKQPLNPSPPASV